MKLWKIVTVAIVILLAFVGVVAMSFASDAEIPVAKLSSLEHKNIKIQYKELDKKTDPVNMTTFVKQKTKTMKKWLNETDYIDEVVDIDNEWAFGLIYSGNVKKHMYWNITGDLMQTSAYTLETSDICYNIFWPLVNEQSCSKYVYDFSDLLTKNPGSTVYINCQAYENSTIDNETIECLAYELYVYNATDFDPSIILVTTNFSTANGVTYNLSVDTLGDMTYYKNSILLNTTISTTGEYIAPPSAGSSATNWTWHNMTWQYNGTQKAINESWVNTTGLVGLWHLDNSTADASGYGNNGVLYGRNTSCASTVTGMFGTACDFDGLTDYIEIPNSPSINNFTNISGMTMSAWVKPNINGTPMTGAAIYNIINKENYPAKIGYRIIYYNAVKQLSCAIHNGTDWSYLTISKNIDNTWTHVACVWNGTHRLLYANGVLIGSAAKPTVLVTSPTPLKISQKGEERFNGTIDEVAIFNRSLSNDEIKNMIWDARNATITTQTRTTILNLSGLVGWWPLDNSTTDISGIGNILSSQNGAHCGSDTTGKFSTACNFDGINDVIVNTSAVPALYLNQTGTISAWVKSNISTTQGDWRGIVSKASGGSAPLLEYSLYWANTTVKTLNIIISNGISAQTVVSPAAWVPTVNQWYHVAATFNNSRIILYVDGVQIISSERTVMFINGTQKPLYIGRAFQSTQIWNGSIDEVAVFNRSLSADEILMLNSSTNPMTMTSWQAVTGDSTYAKIVSTAGIYIQPKFILQTSDANRTPFLINFSIFGDSDISPPTISNLVVTPANNTPWINNTSYKFNATIVDDSAIASVWMVFNGTNYTVSSKNGTVYSFEPFNLAVGQYSYQWFAKDAFNYTNNSALLYYTVMTALAPTKPTIYAPANQTYAGNMLINYSASVTQNGVALAKYNISLLNANKVFVATISANNYPNLNLTWNSSAVADGTYIVEIDACDVNNFCNATYSVNFSTDNTLPVVTLQKPLDTSWNISSTIPFLFIPTDINLDHCNLYTNSTGTWAINASNSTPVSGIVNNITAFMYDGSHKWNIWCNDSMNNIGWAAANFTVNVDTVDPVVTLNKPLTNNWTQNETTTVNYTFTETNPVMCQLYVNSTGSWSLNLTNTTITSAIDNYFTQRYYDGSHLWNVWCNDSAGRSGWATANRTFNVDTINPIIALNQPLDNSWNTSSTIPFLFTLTEANTARCNLYTNSTGTWAINASNSTPVNGINNITAYIYDGSHLWNVWCNDSAGRLAVAPANFTVNIDTTAPVVQTMLFNFTNIPNGDYRLQADLYSTTSDIDSWNFTNATAISFSNTSLVLNISSVAFPINQNLTVRDKRNLTATWIVNLSLVNNNTYQNESGTVNLTYQILARKTVFNSTSVNNVNISWRHRDVAGGTLLNDQNGTIANLSAQAVRTEWSGDWIDNVNFSKSVSASTIVVGTSYNVVFRNNITAQYNFTGVIVNLSDSYWNLTNTSLAYRTNENFSENVQRIFEVNLSGVLVNETSHDACYFQQYGNRRHWTCPFYARVVDSVASDVQISYPITTNRLEEWNGRYAGSESCEVDGVSASVSCAYTNDYANVTILTNFSASSGNHTVKIKYELPQITVAGGGGGAGGIVYPETTTTLLIVNITIANITAPVVITELPAQFMIVEPSYIRRYFNKSTPEIFATITIYNPRNENVTAYITFNGTDASHEWFEAGILGDYAGVFGVILYPQTARNITIRVQLPESVLQNAHNEYYTTIHVDAGAAGTQDINFKLVRFSLFGWPWDIVLHVFNREYPVVGREIEMYEALLLIAVIAVLFIIWVIATRGKRKGRAY